MKRKKLKKLPKRKKTWRRVYTTAKEDFALDDKASDKSLIRSTCAVSKKSITIGDVGLDKIFKAIRDACKPAGTCVTDDIDIKGQFLGKGLTSEVDNIKVTLKPGGSYREVHHDKLLELLEAAVRKVAKCEQYTHKSPCSFTQGYCPNQEKTVTTCKTPSYWSVNLQTEKEAKHDSAPPTIEVNVSMKVVDDTICEDVFGKLEEFGGMCEIAFSFYPIEIYALHAK
ncbi:unnamed protein product [Periconia digitata]|uniref:Uncharacterized protein n=1 Tax=Periconia digitata TaxID=1303443 RepID=A0A9W4XPW8_9PLEO|nr:unnamed protein product [Periconia digitata]